MSRSPSNKKADLLSDAQVDNIDATSVECPTCGAWVGWACEGRNYGYHAAGYHKTRRRAAEHAATCAATASATTVAKGTP